MRPGELQHILPVRLNTAEYSRLRLRADQQTPKMSLSAYIRMLLARDWGDYQSQEQKAKEWFLGPNGGDPHEGDEEKFSIGRITDR
jgi:hypothetical protein